LAPQPTDLEEDTMMRPKTGERKETHAGMLGIVIVTAMLFAGILPVFYGMTTAAEEPAKPVIYGFVGVSSDDTVSALEAMDGITVELYKSFNIFDTSPVQTYVTSHGGYYEFTVSPGYYVLKVESKLDGTSFYHINTNVHSGGEIALPKVSYGDAPLRRDIALTEETINAHVYGVVSDNGSPVDGADVTIYDETTGFTASATTNAQGEFLVETYAGSFNVRVDVGDTPRHYSDTTVSVVAHETETFTLSYSPLNLEVKVNDVAVDSSRYSLNGTTLEVNGLSNKDHVVAVYDRVECKNESSGPYNYETPVVTVSNAIYEINSVTNTTDGANFTSLVEGVDYNVSMDTGEINVTTPINGTLYVNYTYLVSTTEDWYVGRNVYDINISGFKVAGRIIDNETGVPAYGVQMDVVMVDKASYSIYKTTASGPTFSITVPAGTYVLVVYPEGYEPYTDTSVQVTGDVDTGEISVDSLTPAGATTTHITFSDDWNTITVEKKVTLNAYDYLPGVGDDVRNIRYQIDMVYGNGDGTLTQAEVDSFVSYVENRHMEYLSTQDFFTFNGTVYVANESTYSVEMVVPGLNSTSPVSDGDTTPVDMVFKANYTAETPVEGGKDSYTLMLSVEHNTGTYRISLPSLYVRSDDPDSNEPVSPGKVDVVVDSSDNFGTIQMTISKISTPVPVINVQAENMVEKEEGVYVVPVGTNVTFDGSESHVENGAIDEYLWDFGDGQQSGWTSDSVAYHNYTAPSATTGWTVKLTVKDTAGQTNQTTVKIIVDGSGPSVTITVEGNTTVGQNEDIQFNATVNDDVFGNDTENMSFSWDFGDGEVSTEMTPVHSYADPGEYTVTLNVTDQVGNVGTGTIVINVTDTTPPTAAFIIVNATIKENQVVEFNASTSRDNEGNITEYIWDFGDGTNTTTQNATVTHVFTKVGTYNVTLTVVDEAGNSDSITREVNVRLGPRPNLEVVNITILGDAVKGKSVTVVVMVRNRGDGDCGGGTLALKDGSIPIDNKSLPAIPAGGEVNVTFTWKPDSKGVHSLTAEVYSGEEYYTMVTDNKQTKTVDVQPSALQKYLPAIVVVVVIVVFVVLVFFRDRITGMTAKKSGPEKEKKEKPEKKSKK